MSDLLFDVRDKVIVITGASGQLGMEYVKAFLTAGAKVAALDINPIPKLNNISNDSLCFYKVNILSKKDLKNALYLIQRDFGEPEVLINNAGIDSPPSDDGANTGTFESFPEDSWDKIIDVNLKGTFLCSQVFGAQMAANNSGSIINISSIYGIVSPDQSLYDYKNKDENVFFKPVAYSASKSGVINLTRYLATYWASKNVRVNTLTIAGVWNDQDKEFLENYTKRIPIGRMAKQDEYSGALIFLASNASNYMTGSNMIIDGGWTAI